MIRDSLSASRIIVIIILIHGSLAHSAGDKLEHSVGRWPYNSKINQSTILELLHDTNGAFWLLTLEGLSRFDGDDFLNFRTYKPDTGFIPTSNITQIIEDSYGQIYVLTEDKGLLQYDEIRDQFFQIEWHAQSIFRNAPLSAGFADEVGNIWLANVNGEVFRAKPSINSIEKIELSLTNQIVDFTQSSEGTVYAISQRGEIVKFSRDGVDGSKITNPCKTSNSAFVEISAISDELFWIATRNTGLYNINILDQSCYEKKLRKGAAAEESLPIIHEVLYSKSQDLTWVATDLGLYRIDVTEEVARYETSNSRISDNWVITIKESQDGIYWIGTYDGLNYVVPTHFEIYGKAKSEKIGSVVGIDSLDEKGVYIAMYDGIKYFDADKKLHADLQEVLKTAELKKNQIMSLHVNQSGVWIGYHSSGLDFYSFQTKDKTFFGVSDQNRLSSNAISKVISTKSGEVLVGTYGGGLNILFGDGRIETIQIGDNKIIMLHETKAGLIIIGTESGLYTFFVSSRKLNKISFDFSQNSFFSEPLFWSIAESTNGDLWLGSKLHGLFLWKQDYRNELDFNQTPQVIHQARNLTVYAIEIDNFGKIWISTNSGLLSYDPAKEKMDRYSVHHGLQKMEFDHGVSHKDLMGNIYFGGNSGYVRFDPSLIKPVTSLPKIILNKVERASSSGVIHPRSSAPTSKVIVKQQDYFIKFTFSVLDFLDPDKNQYRYKLEGFDPEWIDNGSRNTATYTNLPPGSYTLRVQGANSAGIWNREGLTLSVQVLPAWWLTWWAYAFYILSSIAAVYGLIRVRDTYIVKEQALGIAHNMQEVALRSEDDLQEQYELQDRLLQSVYHHNKASLELATACINSQSEFLTDPVYREAIESSTRRVDALSVLESCKYYQGDQILADLNKFTEIIIPRLLKGAPVRPEAVTTINDISSRLVPAAIASPLAIVIVELLENCLRHAFEEESAANYIQLVSTLERSEGSHDERYILQVRDSGQGLPGNIDLDALETSGLALVSSLVTSLSGKLQIFAEGGTTVSVVVPLLPT